MSCVKLVHCADLHLDSAYADLPKNKAALRRDEARAALRKIVDAVSEKGADILLISGDLFDSPSPSRQTLDFTARELEKAGVPVFIAAGNHDFLSENSCYLADVFPENVRVFGRAVEKAELLPLGVAVYGASFFAPTSPPLLSGFRAQGGGINIMCVHGEIRADSEYNAISRDDIENSGLDYLALGHNHAYSGNLLFGKTACVVCGAHDPHGFDETGEKGFVFAEVSPGKTAVEFIPISERSYETLEFDVSEYLFSHDTADAILPLLKPQNLYKIILTGSVPPEADINISALAARLEDAAFFVKIKDKTGVRVDIGALLKEEGARGAFARALKAQSLDGEAFSLALKVGLAALGGKEAF